MTFLSPVLSLLLKRGQEATADAVEKVGTAAWKRAQGIWGKLWPKLEGDPVGRQAAEAVAQNPDDDAAKGALQFRLRSLIEADPELAAELQRMIDSAEASGDMAANGGIINKGTQTASHGGVVIGGNVSGSVTTNGKP